MLTHERMIKLQAKDQISIDTNSFWSEEEYVLHLIHTFAYDQASLLVEDKTVLDLGCNTGYGTEILSRKAKKATGVDVSRNAISIAKQKFTDSNIEFHLIDGKHLPFNDNEFDVIVSCQVIEHIVDYNIYINELKRVLAPAGIVFFTTPNASLRLYPGMKPWYKFHVREFKHDELKILLEDYFSNVKVMGVFASDSVYQIEKNRVVRIRERAKNKQRNIFYKLQSKIMNLLPANVISELKKLSRKNKKINRSFINKYGLKDLFYRCGELEAALDLLAICADDLTAIKDIDQKLTCVSSDT